MSGDPYNDDSEEIDIWSRRGVERKLDIGMCLQTEIGMTL